MIGVDVDVANQDHETVVMVTPEVLSPCDSYFFIAFPIALAAFLSAFSIFFYAFLSALAAFSLAFLNALAAFLFAFYIFLANLAIVLAILLWWVTQWETVWVKAMSYHGCCERNKAKYDNGKQCFHGHQDKYNIVFNVTSLYYHLIPSHEVNDNLIIVLFILNMVDGNHVTRPLAPLIPWFPRLVAPLSPWLPRLEAPLPAFLPLFFAFL